MEDYVAEGSIPVDKVVSDVKSCELYVVLVAWRYGYIPTADRITVEVSGAVKGETSITDYEYLAARQQVIHAKGLGAIGGLGWAHDRKGFFIPSKTKEGNEIVYVNLRGDTKVPWNCGNDYCHGGPSPDGRQFVFDVAKFTSNLSMIENF
jgi:hypothetical protein